MATTKQERTGDQHGSASGFEALRGLYRRYVLSGVIGIAIGIVFPIVVSSTAGWLVLSLGVGLGGCCVALGVWGLRLGSAAPVLSSSLNLVQSGRLSEASTLLDTLERSPAAGVRMPRDLQRAMIAVRAGDLEAAARYADRVIAEKERLLYRTTDELQRTAARGIRAWVRAATGDLEGAGADVQAVRASSGAAADALAHAALAEAMVRERRGDRAALSSVLRKNRRLLMAGLDVRERAIVRAMQRMLKAAPASVYRTAADPKKESDAEREPPIHEWLGRVAPELAAFAPKPPAQGARDAQAPPPSFLPSARAMEQVAAAQPPKKSRHLLARLVVIWGMIVGLLVMLREMMEEPTPSIAYVLPPEPVADPALGLVGVAFVALVVGAFAWRVRRNQGKARRLQALAAAIAKGDDVDAELAKLAHDEQPLIVAQAELLRSAVRDRRGHLELALAHIDAGRSKLTEEADRAAAGGMLSPALGAARAYALAALKRVDESAAELLRLPADYLFLDRTRFTVELVGRLAIGDVDGAGRLVEATPAELTMGPRDELLRDLVRAATAPNGAPFAEIARLRDELREDQESRRWIELVAPALLARFDQAAVVDEAERESAAEQESAAVDEAAAEERVAAMGARS